MQEQAATHYPHGCAAEVFLTAVHQKVVEVVARQCPRDNSLTGASHHREPQVALLDVPCQKSPVKIATYGVINESLLSFWLTTSLILENNFIIPSTLHLQPCSLMSDHFTVTRYKDTQYKHITVISLYNDCTGYQENCPYIELSVL